MGKDNKTIMDVHKADDSFSLLQMFPVNRRAVVLAVLVGFFGQTASA